MVLLVTTDRILAAFEVISTARREELDLPTTLEAQGPIAHEQLIRLARCLQTDPEYKKHVSHSPTVLNSLLRGTKVYVPPPPKKPEPVRGLYTTTSHPFLSFPRIYKYHIPSQILTIYPILERRISRIKSTPPRSNRTRILQPTLEPKLPTKPRPRGSAHIALHKRRPRRRGYADDLAGV